MYNLELTEDEAHIVVAAVIRHLKGWRPVVSGDTDDKILRKVLHLGNLISTKAG